MDSSRHVVAVLSPEFLKAPVGIGNSGRSRVRTTGAALLVAALFWAAVQVLGTRSDPAVIIEITVSV